MSYPASKDAIFQAHSILPVSCDPISNWGMHIWIESWKERIKIGHIAARKSNKNCTAAAVGNQVAPTERWL